MTRAHPGLSRRDFLRIGAVAGPASVVAAGGWDGGPAIEPRLRGFSRLNDWVGERVFQSSHRLGKEYPASARTTMDNFPSYSITYNQTGSFPSPANAQQWSLDIGGLVRKPVRL